MSEWRLIDSAPQDGTMVLGLEKNERYPVLVMWEIGNAIHDGFWRDQNHYSYAEITHWMPLPEPPK